MLTKDDALALLHLMLGEGRVRPVLMAHVIAWVQAARDPVAPVVD